MEQQWFGTTGMRSKGCYHPNLSHVLSWTWQLGCRYTCLSVKCDLCHTYRNLCWHRHKRHYLSNYQERKGLDFLFTVLKGLFIHSCYLKRTKRTIMWIRDTSVLWWLHISNLINVLFWCLRANNQSVFFLYLKTDVLKRLHTRRYSYMPELKK